MPLPVDKLGTVYPPRRATVEPQRAIEYARATNDLNPAYLSSKYAPPVFGVVPSWESMGIAVGDIVPAESLMMIVHGEQDMYFHRPLAPGRELITSTEAYSVRVASSGTRFAVRVTSNDAEDGQPVLEQYVTMFIRGLVDGDDGGPDTPDHGFPAHARSVEPKEVSFHVDADQTFRYARASGDEMPIHVDDAVAKSVGLPGIIAHGLFTLAMVSKQAIGVLAAGDPERLRRLAARFAKPVFPGNDVTVRFYDLGASGNRSAVAFEAFSLGETVLSNGRVELATGS